MSGALQNKMTSLEVAPPKSAWEGIAKRLDDEFWTGDIRLSSRMEQADVIPPTSCWKLILTSLDHHTDAEVQTSPAKEIAADNKPAVRVIPARVIQTFYRRFVAAAVIAGVAALFAWYLLSREDYSGGKLQTAVLQRSVTGETARPTEKKTFPGGLSNDSQETAQNSRATGPEPSDNQLRPNQDITQRTDDQGVSGTSESEASSRSGVPTGHLPPGERSRKNNPGQFNKVRVPVNDHQEPQFSTFNTSRTGRQLPQSQVQFLHTVSALKPVAVHAPPIRDERGNIIMDLSVIKNPGDRYIVVTGPNGHQTRISAKFLPCLSSLNNSSYLDLEMTGHDAWAEQCKSKFNEWREILSQSAIVPAAGNFFDIFELKEMIEER